MKDPVILVAIIVGQLVLATLIILGMIAQASKPAAPTTPPSDAWRVWQRPGDPAYYATSTDGKQYKLIEVEK